MTSTNYEGSGAGAEQSQSFREQGLPAQTADQRANGREYQFSLIRSRAQIEPTTFNRGAPAETLVRAPARPVRQASETVRSSELVPVDQPAGQQTPRHGGAGTLTS